MRLKRVGAHDLRSLGIEPSNLAVRAPLSVRSLESGRTRWNKLGYFTCSWPSQCILRCSCCYSRVDSTGAACVQLGRRYLRRINVHQVVRRSQVIGRVPKDLDVHRRQSAHARLDSTPVLALLQASTATFTQKPGWPSTARLRFSFREV